MAERKTITVSAQVPPEDKIKLLEIAAKEDRTLSWVVREAIKQYIANATALDIQKYERQ